MFTNVFLTLCEGHNMLLRYKPVRARPYRGIRLRLGRKTRKKHKTDTGRQKYAGA